MGRGGKASVCLCALHCAGFTKLGGLGAGFAFWPLCSDLCCWQTASGFCYPQPIARGCTLPLFMRVHLLLLCLVGVPNLRSLRPGHLQLLVLLASILQPGFCCRLLPFNCTLDLQPA